MRLSVFVLIVGAVVAVATVHGMREQLPKQTPSEGMLTTAKLLSQVKEYYRSHELPPGWELGEITDDATCINVNIHFLPSLNSPRYGQAADPSEIDSRAGCPQAANLWTLLDDRCLTVRLHDRSGSIGDLSCQAPVAD